MPTILENFDSPQMGPNCVERGESNVAPQALHLLNNRTVYELAGQFAERILREVPGDLADPSVTERRLIRAHRIALGRTPGRDEVLAAASALDGLRQEWSVALQGQPDALAEAGRRAWRNYCHALLNAAEFVYVD